MITDRDLFGDIARAFIILLCCASRFFTRIPPPPPLPPADKLRACTRATVGNGKRGRQIPKQTRRKKHEIRLPQNETSAARASSFCFRVELEYAAESARTMQSRTQVHLREKCALLPPPCRLFQRYALEQPISTINLRPMT